MTGFGIRNVERLSIRTVGDISTTTDFKVLGVSIDDSRGTVAFEVVGRPSYLSFYIEDVLVRGDTAVVVRQQVVFRAWLHSMVTQLSALALYGPTVENDPLEQMYRDGLTAEQAASRLFDKMTEPVS